MTYFPSLLIANRGEIAVRIIRACRTLGIEAIAVYSEADARALHVREADRALLIGPAAAAHSYLNIAAILAAARRTGAAAIHPGYGFLSENAAFARACAEANIVFVGPSPESIEMMGSKSAAKKLAEQAGVPTVPGYNGDDQAPEQLLEHAERVGFPLLIKASAGGGGKGMRAVYHADEFMAALAGAQREAKAAFGDDHVLLERLIARPRHIEFQIVADHFGNVVHLGERECSIQRRHQKIVEESPSVALSPTLRAEMGAAAVRLAQLVGYRNAGTMEFMLDTDGRFYFLEMNTRLQVEHPVTEEVTGIDLVQTQLAIAAGEPLPFTQNDIMQHGHAIEVRLYAEDSVQMLPSIGTLTTYQPPEGPGVRLDTGVTVGDTVTVNYDPMLAKLIVVGADRAQAVARLRFALATFVVAGVQTNIPLLSAIAAHPAYTAGETYTDFLTVHAIADHLITPIAPPAEALFARALFDLVPAPSDLLPVNPWAMRWRAAHTPHTLRYVTDAGPIVVIATPQDAGAWRLVAGEHSAKIVVLRRNANKMAIRIGEQIGQALLLETGLVWNGTLVNITPAPPLNLEAAAKHAGNDSDLAAPMPGSLIKVLVNEGDDVTQGQPLVIMEAMKMEHTIVAPYAGRVVRLPYAVGAQVAGGVILVEMSNENIEHRA